MKPLLKLRITGMVLRFALLYGLLYWGWIGVKDFYPKVFRNAAQYMFGEFGSSGVVIFQPVSEQEKLDKTFQEHDVTVLFLNQQIMDELSLQASNQGNTGTVEVKVEIKKSFLISRTLGYIPTIFVVALVLATPSGTSRKLSALFAGLILVNCFVAIRLMVFVLHEFSHRESLSVILLSPFWKNVLSEFYYILVLNIGTTEIVPVFIWILVSFRRSDWNALVD